VRGGGLYDPRRNAWTPVTLTGAPTKYADFAVWTGRSVIVLGRTGESDGIYDPRGNTWRPMVPPTRSAGWQIVAWDGCRVLAQGSEGFYVYHPPPGI
jgi:hypothetical protein